MDDLAQGPYAIAYRAYWAAGWSNVLPVHDGQGRPGKSHVPRGYTGQDGRNVSWPDLNAWATGDEGRHNLGVRLVAMVGIDVDAHDGEQGAATLAKAEAELGPLPPTWSSTSRGEGPSRILFFRVPLEREAALRRREKVFNDTFGPNIEILHRGHRFAVCWPSVHPDTGLTYQWYGPDGIVCGAPPKRGDVPLLPDTWLDFLAPAEPLRTTPDMSTPGGSVLFGTSAAVPDYRTEQEAARILREAVQAFIAPDADGRARRLLPALALTAGHGVPGGFWTAEQASTQIEAMGIACGYVKKHGLADLRLQVERGLRDGAATPWVKVAQPEHDAFASAQESETSAEDEVSALLAEMLTADELAARKPPRYMIEGFLQYDSESWLIGEPGAKKSFVALDMAACVATGRMWQGRRVNPALVVFIVAEGAGGSSPRVRAWKEKYGPMGDCIRFLPRPVQSSDAHAWGVLVQACARLAGVARESGRGMFVVIDTQARVTVGLKENDATDMGVFIDALGAIRAATGGACVMPIHHTGRRGGDARGSSAIDGAQTTELKVVKTGDLAGQVVTEKQKDIAEAEPVEIRFKVIDLGQDEDGRKVDSLVLLEPDEWRRGEVDEETIKRQEREQQDALELSPFRVRAAPEEWTHRLAPRSPLDRWLLQALADIALDYGLRKAEWLNQLARKRHDGKTYSQSKENWEDNFQRIVSDTGPARAAGIVVKVHGADRWTVDRIALDAFKKGDETGS